MGPSFESRESAEAWANQGSLDEELRLDRFRRLLAATLACFFAGCAVSAETTGGQLNGIKPGMTREQVVSSSGEPARTDS